MRKRKCCIDDVRSDAVLGMKAGVYRKGGVGLVIRYAVAESFLGPVIVGFTERGVCAMEFSDSLEGLLLALQSRFPEAGILEGGPDLAAHVSDVAAFIRSPEKGLSLPLDIQGTAFQQRVWQELRKIPAGETRTYSEVAEAMGVPSSVRAVASACARNKIAVAIPCHRVVRKGGGLGGYYWGLERKRMLLENEKKSRENQTD
ncbi:methylated-DNA--[protein]-cysteine S-methyltransferase [uncultured Pseudodesulfovibrio sp.]|uniref:methylated-DNA--[protein]-cysteine S-methyltransferase n=1 Tax=uncultured Pseudodesulfovibrio sp. TaxID=2035858 RepID=UPI0029C69EAD|nr:methylated-DNA--[protein]-cysteine S-methyltransferase [uncultured Pseudodesulfovibrio sp.]